VESCACQHARQERPVCVPNGACFLFVELANTRLLFVSIWQPTLIVSLQCQPSSVLWILQCFFQLQIIFFQLQTIFFLQLQIIFFTIFFQLQTIFFQLQTVFFQLPIIFFQLPIFFFLQLPNVLYVQLQTPIVFVLYAKAILTHF